MKRSCFQSVWNIDILIFFQSVATPNKFEYPNVVYIENQQTE